MKINSYYTLIYSIVFLIIFVFSNNSCFDKCKDKLCANGYCIKGDCFCDDGYSGENCEIKESDKFIGNWFGQIKCDFLEQTIKTRISNNYKSPRKILLQFDNFSKNMELSAHIFEDSIFIENQFVESIDSYMISGQVHYDTILNLIYPSEGILKNDTILEFDLKIKGDEYLQCKVNLRKN